MECLSRMTIKLSLVVTALILASCGGGSQSYEYHAADDPLPGPGLFSGPDGTFTIYQSMEEKDAVDKESSNR